VHARAVLCPFQGLSGEKQALLSTAPAAGSGSPQPASLMPPRGSLVHGSTGVVPRHAPVDFGEQPLLIRADCPFYRLAWHTFLAVAQPDAAGTPAFLGYPTIGSVRQRRRERIRRVTRGLLSLAVRDGKGRTTPFRRTRSRGVQQAGLRNVLVDQHGHSIYYAIHSTRRSLTSRGEPPADRRGLKAAIRSSGSGGRGGTQIGVADRRP